MKGKRLACVVRCFSPHNQAQSARAEAPRYVEACHCNRQSSVENQRCVLEASETADNPGDAGLAMTGKLGQLPHLSRLRHRSRLSTLRAISAHAQTDRH